MKTPCGATTKAKYSVLMSEGWPIEDVDMTDQIGIFCDMQHTVLETDGISSVGAKWTEPSCYTQPRALFHCRYPGKRWAQSMPPHFKVLCTAMLYLAIREFACEDLHFSLVIYLHMLTTLVEEGSAARVEQCAAKSHPADFQGCTLIHRGKWSGTALAVDKRRPTSLRGLPSGEQANPMNKAPANGCRSQANKRHN